MYQSSTMATFIHFIIHVDLKTHTGVRQYCGHTLPDGLVKNQKLEANLLTPTTKVIE